FKSARDGQLVEQRLKEVRSAADKTNNLLPTLRQALKDRCTLGEVCGAMKEVFGEYQPTF
ncbi:MAG: methylmalonyl-CoA mutase family protein, partial [Thermoplasmata archaeon]|nr:methylmalonyl-CoA mutase family protein [Thermoplasmata archaeon]